MLIKSVELENFRSYEKQNIEFHGGINFLSGDIGSGKSSILQAIEFALFGFKRGDLEGYHILRKGQREASVKLLIEDERGSYEIFRRIKKGKTVDTISQENGYIKVDNNLLDLSPTELNYKVFDILNFPNEFVSKDKNLIYRFTIYTPQEQLKEVLFAESDKKLEIIRKLFKIDKYKQLKDAIQIYMAKIREEKNKFQGKLENKETLSQELENYKKQIKEFETKLESITEKAKPIEEKALKYKEALRARDELREKLQNNLILIEKKLTRIEEIEINDIKSKKKLVKLEREFKELKTDKTDLKELEKKLESLEKLKKLFF